MGIFEQIKDNSITELTLSVPTDEIADDVHEFFKALGENKSIETVKLNEDFIGDLRQDTRIELLQALGSVPTLKEVHLADGLLMITGITKMVTDAKSLKVLSLKDVVLQGTSEHFTAAEAALYQHPCLKEFELIDCVSAMKDVSLGALEKAGQKFSTGGGATSIEPVHNAQSAKTA
jgi:Ran GTPase-activating protein (RanGAP) involved in mRNA processing and transport